MFPELKAGGLETHIELAIGLELLLLNGYWSETPATRIEVALHNAALDLCYYAMIAG